MKVIIQIPCFNEAETLGMTVQALPSIIVGFDKVEYLVINDGSTDNTVEIAQRNGVHHIVNLPQRLGLANAYMVGLEHCIQLGADVIVNTDGDNQYNADDIEKLILPILRNEADMSIGVRPISQVKHFSLNKKILHAIGNYVLRKISKLDISDASSGFRAVSRDAAMRFNVFTHFTYTLETILQTVQKGITVATVPIRVNPESRPSRLMTSLTNYVVQSAVSLLRLSVIHQPFHFFLRIGLVSSLIAFFLFLIYLHLLLSDGNKGRIEIVILAAVFFGISFQAFIVACLADSLAAKRKILEDLQYRVKLRYFSKCKE